MIKCLRTTTYKEERFIWVNAFRGLSPCLLGPIAMGLWWGKTSWWESGETKLLISGWPGSKEKEEPVGSQYTLQGCAPNDLLPSPKASRTSQQHCQLGSKPLYKRLWGTFRIQTIESLLINSCSFSACYIIFYVTGLKECRMLWNFRVHWSWAMNLDLLGCSEQFSLFAKEKNSFQLWAFKPGFVKCSIFSLLIWSYRDNVAVSTRPQSHHFCCAKSMCLCKKWNACNITIVG